MRDLWQHIKVKRDKKPSTSKRYVPDKVDTEGTPESREKIKKLFLLSDPELHEHQLDLKTKKQIKESLKTRIKRKAKKRMSNVEASGVSVGLGTQGGSGAM